MSARSEARAAGRSTYSTGAPCSHGHLSPRYTTSKGCCECGRLKSLKYYAAKGREASPARHRLARYGITPAAYDGLLLDQENGCAICHASFDHEPGHRPSAPVVDHNHETRAVRGLLCHNCNRGLGMFKENTSSLLSAIAYLQFHEAPQ